MNNKNYNIFLLLSTISRNLIEVLNVLLLYKKDYTIKQILLFYIIYFLIGILTTSLVIYLSNYIKTKYILLISIIFLCISYYYLNIMNNNIISLIILSILSSISSHSYHTIRHYFAMHCNNKDKNIGNYLIFTLLGVSLSLYINTYLLEHYTILVNIIIVSIISILSLIPLSKIIIPTKKEPIKNINISKKKTIFFILEQSKVLYFLICPLYLYIYIQNKITYIGIFNIIISISSIISIYILVRNKYFIKYFKYINILLVIILILKLNITNSKILLLIAFNEGILTKFYEIVSTKNLYQINISNIKSYLLKVEIIFLTTRIIFLLIFYLSNINLKQILYILTVIILLSGLIIKQDVKDK